MTRPSCPFCPLIEEMLITLPKLAVAHAVDHRPRHVEQRVEIGADHLAPLLVRHLLEHRVARDAGVVDQHLDRADLVLNADDALLAGDVIADVPFEDRDLGFLLERLGGLVVARIIGRDVIASLLQCLADGGANTTRTSRDESHSPHNAFLPLGALYGACFPIKSNWPRAGSSGARLLHALQTRFSHARRTWRCPCRHRCRAWQDLSWRRASASRARA